MTKARKHTRLYGGLGGEERRAQRRLRLIEAAIRVYGEAGYRNATVKAVCEAADLTERYFYESFANSEALLLAAYTHITDELHAEMEAVGSDFGDDAEGRIVAVLTLYFTRLRENPRSARVFLLKIAGISPAVDVMKMKAVKRMSEVLLPASGDQFRVGKKTSLSLLPTGMIGAVISIALRWVSHNYSQPTEDVVAAAAAFCRVAMLGIERTASSRSSNAKKSLRST